MQSFSDKANPPPDIRWLPCYQEHSAPRALRVLVACEFSGIVRDAFLEKGHDAWSCDLLPAEHNSNRHIQCDAREILNDGWDFLIVAHPPCTRLCNSGVRWLHKAPPGKTLNQMWRELRKGAELFSDMWNAPIPHICVENPVMHSHAETKRTCFWLKNLPQLRPTNIVEGRTARVHRMPPSPDRWRERSRFFPGIARAMADQWSDPVACRVDKQMRLI